MIHLGIRSRAVVTIVMSVDILAQAIRAISNFVWEQRQHGRREGLRHADV